MTIVEKQKALEQIAKQIAKCKICQKDKIGKAVPGEGNANANIIFIGEAPGKNEAETGRPFVGRAGKLLRVLIGDAGIEEKKVYITSPVKYLPKYVTPTPSDIEHGRKHLLKQLRIIQPKIVVLLGNVACKALIPEHSVRISIDHGTIYKNNGISYFISYHPAAPLHSPGLRQTLIDDFKKLKKFVNSK